MNSIGFDIYRAVWIHTHDQVNLSMLEKYIIKVVCPHRKQCEIHTHHLIYVLK